jgi:hypothetical protein
MKETKKKEGRPTVITEMVLSELKTAYCLDATDKEACDFAEISEKTLYNYQKKNPEFLQQKQGWKTSVILEARKSVFEAIQKDAWLALRYLQSRLPQEFTNVSTRKKS